MTIVVDIVDTVVVGDGAPVVVVVVVSANATAGVLRPRAAIMLTATTPRVLKRFIVTPFKGTLFTVRQQISRILCAV